MSWWQNSTGNLTDYNIHYLIGRRGLIQIIREFTTLYTLYRSPFYRH